MANRKDDLIITRGLLRRLVNLTSGLNTIRSTDVFEDGEVDILVSTLVPQIEEYAEALQRIVLRLLEDELATLDKEHEEKRKQTEEYEERLRQEYKTKEFERMQQEWSKKTEE